MVPSTTIPAPTSDAQRAGAEQLKIFREGLDESIRAALDALHVAHAVGGDPIEIDDAGWMHGTNVTSVPLRDKMQALVANGTTYRANALNVTGIVAHWTDTRGAGAVNLAKRIQVLGGAARSCHVWIGADGAIAQSAPFTRGTWHAGSGSAALFYALPDGTWEPSGSLSKPGSGKHGANSWAAGIEHENVGEVRMVNGVWRGWPFGRSVAGEGLGAIVPFDEVQVLPGHTDRGHHKFADAQIAASTRVYTALVRKYNLKRANCAWGHCQIDPELRTDPGPLFLGPRLDGTAGHIKTILDSIFGVTP